MKLMSRLQLEIVVNREDFVVFVNQSFIADKKFYFIANCELFCAVISIPFTVDFR